MTEEKPKPKTILDQGYSAKEEMPCEKCGAIVKLKQSYLNVAYISICPQCGAEYNYIFCELPFDAGPDEWA